MSLHLNSNNFNGGELSPLVYGRNDLQKYGTSAKLLENFIPTKYGPIERSTGFECVFDSAATPAVVETKSNGVCRLKSFRFSTSTSYMLAFTDQTIRFYKGGTTASQIETAPGVPYEVTTPYLAADIFKLHIRQINDVMYITHPSYAVRKLSRLSEASWTLTEVTWDFPPLLDENETTITLYPSATAGSTTIVASAAAFTSDMEGGYVAIRQTRDAQEIRGTRLLTTGGNDIDLDDATATSAAIKVKGPWTFNISAGNSATFDLQRRYDGGPWGTVQLVTCEPLAAYTISGIEEDDDVEFRLDYTKGTGALTDPVISFRVEDIDITGFAKITTFNSTTNVSVTVLKDFEKSGSGEAVTTWSMGAFSDEYGHPRAITFHQQRLWFGGTSNEKQRIWGSQTGDFENFDRSTEDDGGIAVDLASDQQNEIMWMRSQRNLLLGTSANEWTIGSDSFNGAITPSNITARLHTSEGSEDIPALLAGNKALFLTRNTRKLQSFFFNFQIDGYDSEEISKLSEHLFRGTITQSAYSQIRDQIVYFIRDDGEMPSLVFNQNDNVIAFFRRNNPALDFESVDTMYGDGDDEIWVVLEGTINGTQKRFICREAAKTTTQADMVYVDLAVTKTGTASTTWTFPHLANTTVDVLADGWVAQGLLADGTGQITLPLAATKVTAGLPYTSQYRSLNIEAPTGDGSSKGKKKRIHRIDLGLYNSLGGEYGIAAVSTPTNEVNTSFIIPTRVFNVSQFNNAPTLKSGVFPLTMPPGNYSEVDLVVTQSQPLPMTITHTFPVVNTKGD